jgi:hypothetical protein
MGLRRDLRELYGVSSLPHSLKNMVSKNGCLNRPSINNIVIGAQLRNLGEVVRLMILRVVRS